MIPDKLRPGDEVRVVSPSSGLGFIPEGLRMVAARRLEGLGLRISYGGAGEVLDRFESSPVGERVSELHEAFADDGVRGMLTIIGGYNSNQLLARLDYDLIRGNPQGPLRLLGHHGARNGHSREDRPRHLLRPAPLDVLDGAGPPVHAGSLREVLDG